MSLVRKLQMAIIFVLLKASLMAQEPVIRVDMNMSGRPLSEVHEPGYTAWPVPTTNDSISNTYEGVTITFTCMAPEGGRLDAEWYKTGIQTGLSRLANDGLWVEYGDNGAQIQMRISGLPEGTHTLLTYHNTYSNPEHNTFSPIDIYLDDSLVYNDLMPTNRVTYNIEMSYAYFFVEASEGEDIVVLFAAETSSGASSKNVCISGFELNTPYPADLARQPFPANYEEHADADDGDILLHWLPADNALSHDVYFGPDSLGIATADRSSSLFMGNQTDTTFLVDGLYSMLTYYWRIDEINTEGDTLKGNLWHFRTRHLAFKGAEGYGRFARGGRGGKVVKVTNLNDDGMGSLRYAVSEVEGPRTIVFSVSGIITLNSRLTINQDYITIAGQTAPGKGICVRQAAFGLSGAEDVIIQHIRVRLGSGTTYDGMGMAGSNHSILDHCSISWTIDEGFSSRDADNITLQRTLISEALNVAGHDVYEPGTPHGFAASIGGDIGSFHHNLLAHCFARNWSLAGGLDGSANYAGRLDIFNNVVYNWHARTCEGGAHEVNFVGNYYKPGPAMHDTANHALMAEHDTDHPGSQRYYFSSNVMPGYFDETNQEDGRILYGPPYSIPHWVDESFFPSYATIHSAEDAYKHVLSDVGCTLPVFDDHDIRMIKETINGSYKYTGSISNLPGIPDTEEDVGGWEHYPEIHRPAHWDSDNDGLPNWWETLHGLDTNSALGDFSDANADTDLDGYTNLNDYLEWISVPHFTTNLEQPVFIDLYQLTRGFTDEPEYSITDKVNCDIHVPDSGTWSTFIPDDYGLASFKLTVTDASGSTMTRTVNAYIKSGGVVDTLIAFATNNAADTIFTGNQLHEKNTLLLSCFPNPSKDIVYISIAADQSTPALIQVRDIFGKTLLSKQYAHADLNQPVSLKVANLPAGVYFVTVHTGQKQQTIKFIRY